jgi:hypothetical protein
MPRPLAVLVCALLPTAALAGCSSSDSSNTETVVIERIVEKPANAKKPKRRNGGGGGNAAAAMITVPDVVGENHQYAQDTLQAAGLYLLKEEDATGQGRMLMWDRNWEVVEQDPAPGSKVTEDTTITLRSQKIGE